MCGQESTGTGSRVPPKHARGHSGFRALSCLLRRGLERSVQIKPEHKRKNKAQESRIAKQKTRKKKRNTRETKNKKTKQKKEEKTREKRERKTRKQKINTRKNTRETKNQKHTHKREHSFSRRFRRLVTSLSLTGSFTTAPLRTPLQATLRESRV